VLQGTTSSSHCRPSGDDLNTELDDMLGLPLDTKLDLQPIEAVGSDKRPLEEYVQAAWANNPEIASAEESIKEATAAVKTRNRLSFLTLRLRQRYLAKTELPLSLPTRHVGVRSITMCLISGRDALL